MASTGRRQVFDRNLKSEDDTLSPRDRDRLITQTRYLLRNSSIFGWAVRRYLDTVSTFTFMCRTGNKELDQQIERLMDWWSRPLNCNVTGRHDFYQLIRLIESLKVVDGDCFVYKLDDYRLQVIEGDRIRNPEDLGRFKQKVDIKDFKNGVRLDEYGKPLAYAICNRDEHGKYVLDELVSAEHVFHHAEFQRMDQVRGVSQLAGAVNAFLDIYEAKEYALSKMKLSQLLALKIKRAVLAGEEDDDEVASGYSFDFSGGGTTIELEDGDDAELLESKNPSTEFQAFLQQAIIQALKAFDIPYSFYSENFTNYSGARQALLQYEQAADIKRENLRILLHNITVWLLQLWIADDLFTLPQGVRISDIKFTWVGSPLPWIDPQKEATANATLLENKLTSRTRLLKAQGVNFEDVCDELAAEQAYYRSKGLLDDQVDIGALNDAIAKADAEERQEVVSGSN